MAIDLFTIGKFTVHGYGLMIGIGFALAMLIGGYRAKKLGLNEDYFTNIGIMLLVFGFMGGKLLFIIVNFKQFLASPMSVLGSEGFVVYGGIIVGILTIFIYCKLKKISFLDYMDVLAPSVILCQGFGRIGCFLAGCCYGRPTDAWYGIVFPEGGLAPAGIKLIPTQLFSAGFDLAVAALLIIFARKLKYKGMVSGIYLFAYGLGRFIIEMLRGDEARGAVGTLSTSQFISIFMILFALGYCYFSYKKKWED